MVDAPLPSDLEAQNEVEPTVDVTMVDAPMPQQPEEPQVAGLGKAIMDVVGTVNEAIDDAKPIGRAPQVEGTEVVGDMIIVRDPTEAEVQSFNNILTSPYEKPQTEGVPSPTPNQKAAGIPRAQTNYERVTSTVAEKEVLDSMLAWARDWVAQQRRGERSFEKIIEDANAKAGSGILKMLINRKIGTAFNAEELVAGRIVLWNLNAETTRLSSLVRSGAGTEADKRAFLTALTLEARAAASLLGGQAEAARAIAAARIGIEVDQGRVDEMQRMLSGADDNSVEFLAERYAALPTQEAQAQFARGIIGKGVDVWQEVWINSLLSAFTTHAVNIASNAAFIGLQIPERALAGAIGAARRGITGSKTGVRLGETTAMLHGVRQGMLEGLLFAAQSFKKEEPVSGGLKTKLDIRERKAITAEKFGLDPMSFAGRATDMLGVAVRLPGRFLIAEDEFFKGVSSRMSLHAVAHRRMQDNLAQGMPADQAKRAYEMDVANPSEAVMNEVRDFAEMVTFQKDLGPVMGSVQKMMTNPLAKMFVPFFKTPTNIMKEVYSRTPLALPHALSKAIKEGGPEADKALARVAMGSSIMGLFSMFAGGEVGDDVIITGSGPSKRGSQAAWRRQGFQPYSINIKQDDGTYTSVTYSRFDPISGLLAMAADYADFAKYSDDPDELTNLAMAASMATFEYAGQLPMLQGAAAVAELVGGPYESTADVVQGAINIFTKQAASTVLGPAMGGSMVASIERLVDPTASDTRGNPDLPVGIRGFYEALQSAKSRNPFFSDDVPPKLNLWGEEIKTGQGKWWEMMNPVRVNKAEYRIVDNEIEMLNFVVGGSLSMPRREIDGAGLNATQYNDLLVELNTTMIDGRYFIDAMRDEILDPGYQSMGVEDRVAELNAIKTEYLNVAKEAVVGRYPLLSREIEDNNRPYYERKAIKDSEPITDKIDRMLD